MEGVLKLLIAFVLVASSANAEGTKPFAPAHITSATRNESTPATSIQLASAGKALQPIVISPNASRSTQAVAADFAAIIEKMTGAKFVVQAGDGSRGVVLGTLSEFPNPGIENQLRAVVAADDREAFVIRTEANRVLLLGNTDLGASNAAYRLLQELGCYWLSPASAWEIIPPVRELSWNKNITDRPDVLARRIWYAYPGKSFEAWKRRNNHNAGMQIATGHAYDQVINANQAAFDAHPEYYPLINGERKKTPPSNLTRAAFNASIQPDIGNPAVRLMFLEHARKYFQKNPNADMLSMEPNDGGAYSSSPEFQALGSISDAVFGLANEVARMLQKEFPGKMVGVLAYREHADPPSFDLEPNVYVQITGALFSKYSREELLEMWSQKAANLGFYDYYQPYEWNLDQLPGGTASSYRAVARRIREQVAMNASSIDGQGSGSWFLNGRAYWIGARLMWDSSLDPEELNTEYLRAAFGPAAQNMREFYELWIPDNSPIVSKNLVYEMALKVQQADREAAAHPEILARLNGIKQYLRFLQLDWTLQSLGKSGEYSVREAAFVDLMKHIWRSQESRMNEVALAQQNLFQQRGEASGIIQVNSPRDKVLVNPKLSPRDKENPWKIDTPYTAEETASNWQSTLEYFKSEIIEDQKYSRDLVPIHWQGKQATGVKPDAETVLQVQGSTMNWALYSLQGEPLKVTIAPMSGRHAAWVLRDSNENIVAEDVQKGDTPENERTFEIVVPGAGAYFLDVSPANFVTVRIPADRIASYALRRAAPVNAHGPAHLHQPRCFYVPKGTQKIQMFTGGTPEKPTKIYTPDGKLIEAGAFKEWASIAVPAGMDGKVWRVDAALRTLWFANVPPFVAASPERLLVPREVAEKDGLSIIRP